MTASLLAWRLRPGSDRAFLTILGVEAAERAAWFGVLSLMPLHLAAHALAGVAARRVVGLGAVRQALEGVLGPLAPTAIASLVFGSFTGCAYVTPLLGAVVADRGRSRRATIQLGLVVSTAGCALLASDAGLLIGLVLLVLGAGAIKANMLVQVGALGGERGARGRFAAYLVAVNVGSMIGPFACGWIAQVWGWRAGFFVAAAMLAGATALYASLPRGAARTSATARPRGAMRRIPVVALAALMVPYVLFYTAYNQAFDLLPIWASTHVNLDLWGLRAPVAWFYTVDGVFTIVAASAVAWLWRRGGGPDGLLAVALACALAAIAYIFLGAVAHMHPTPLPAMIAFFAMLDAGLPLIEASTLARLGRLASAGAAGTTLALTSLAFAAADFGAGAIGAAYPRVEPAHFWWLQAVVAGGGVVVLLATATQGRRTTGGGA